jgi:hypothetical protein
MAARHMLRTHNADLGHADYEVAATHRPASRSAHKRCNTRNPDDSRDIAISPSALCARRSDSTKRNEHMTLVKQPAVMDSRDSHQQPRRQREP